MLALHRMRAQLVKFRTAQVNGLRGLLAKYGEVMPQGRAGIRRDVPAALGWLAERLPAVVIDTLREQYARIGELDEQVQQIEQRLQHWHRQQGSFACHRIGNQSASSGRRSASRTSTTHTSQQVSAVAPMASRCEPGCQSA